MPVIPCSTSRPACSVCPDDFPVLNLSAEEPDSGDDFWGFWDGGDIPLGNPFSAKGCVSTVFSNISQADADNKAKQQSKICNLTNNGPPPDGCTDPGQCQNNPDGDNNPDIPTPIARNAEQRASCDSGDLVVVDVTLPYFLTTDGPDLVLAPNVFTAFTQAEADALALNYVENYLLDGLESGVLECSSDWLYRTWISPLMFNGGAMYCYGVPAPQDFDTPWSIPGVTASNTAFSVVPTPCDTAHLPQWPVPGYCWWSFRLHKTFGPYATDKIVSVVARAQGHITFTPGPTSEISEHSVTIDGLNGGQQSNYQGLIDPGTAYDVTWNFNGTLAAGNVLDIELLTAYVAAVASPSKLNSLTGTISIVDAP